MAKHKPLVNEDLDLVRRYARLPQPVLPEPGEETKRAARLASQGYLEPVKVDSRNRYRVSPAGYSEVRAASFGQTNVTAERTLDEY